MSAQRAVMRSAALAALLVLHGCATVPQGSAPDPRDPIESFNRRMFNFNDTLDAAVVKPLAQAYTNVTPGFVRKGVSNFFNNLQDMWSVVNSGLQGRGQNFSDNVGRVMINTTLGLLGVVDVASSLEIDRHTTDFGTTLGRWGVAPGPYVVLPVLGPATLRDVGAMPLDYGLAPAYQLGGNPDANLEITGLQFVDKRANLLGAGNVLDGAALDKYAFMRDSYLQRQRNQQYDGDPPDDDVAP